MAFRFDGKDHNTAEAAIAVAEAIVGQLRSDLSAANTRADTAEARADGAENDLKKARDPKRIAALVESRVRLDSTARQVLGGEYDPNGKSEREVMIDVIRADQAEFEDKGADGKPRSADYIQAAYDRAVQSGVRVDGSDGLRRAIGKTRKNPEEREDEDLDREDGIPDVGSAQASYAERQRNAWKTEAN